MFDGVKILFPREFEVTSLPSAGNVKDIVKDSARVNFSMLSLPP